MKGSAAVFGQMERVHTQTQFMGAKRKLKNAQEKIKAFYKDNSRGQGVAAPGF